MKQTIFTLLLLSAIGMVSCRKHDNQPNIKQYDQQQIQNYIAANNITGMQQDLTGGDTTGIYYKLILQPTDTTALTYSDNISFVYTLKSFDGHFINSDTIQNHYQGYVGHIASFLLPNGLELAILNDLKHVGASMRLLIPSHLAYGVNGYGTGSITNTSSRIAGNQCLDYYVHVINASHDQPTIQTAAKAQAAYDDLVIRNYMANHNLTQYTLDSGIYYKIVTAGTGTDKITDNSTVTATFNGRLLNDVVFDGTYVGTDTTAIQIPNAGQITPGASRMLKKYAVKGSVISMFIPSGQAFSTISQTGVPANSPLLYQYTIFNITP